MKTIREWLEELPEPYRTQALENFDIEGIDNILVSTLADAINKGFIWFTTPQGEPYWFNIHRKIYKNESLDN